MVITHAINMDFGHRGIAPRIDVVQDDKYSRNLCIRLFENGSAWSIPDETTAVVRYKKSDGKGGNYDALPDGSPACSIVGNELIVALAPQVCTVPGVVLLAVGLIHGQQEINTFTVNIAVQANPGINVLSEEYINLHFLDRLEQLERDVADLKYVPVKITSFSCAPIVAEIGSTVTAVLFSWGINKKPSTLTLDGAVLDNSAASTRVDELELTANKTWTLRAVDERGTEAAATATLTFLNGVYYGVGAVPDSIDSSFILGLTKTLRESKLGSFTVNAGDGQYIWYCIPSRFGTCSFKVGGFDGGFDRVAVMDFTNASGYTESYDVYRSANAGLGNTTVGVT